LNFNFCRRGAERTETKEKFFFVFSVSLRLFILSQNKKTLSHDEKGRQTIFALLIFPKPMMLGLDLAPGVEIAFNRLPWCRRASPSTTRHESVKSTDADKLIKNGHSVNIFFPA